MKSIEFSLNPKDSTIIGVDEIHGNFSLNPKDSTIIGVDEIHGN